MRCPLTPIVAQEPAGNPKNKPRDEEEEEEEEEEEALATA
jgi:hypothetical protein